MEDPQSPEFRVTRIKVPSRSHVIGRRVNCGGRGWMGVGLFPWRPKKLDHSDGDSIIKSKFDIIIIRSEGVSLSSVGNHNQQINFAIFNLKLTQESRNIIKVHWRTRTSLLLASKV